MSCGLFSTRAGGRRLPSFPGGNTSDWRKTSRRCCRNEELYDRAKSEGGESFPLAVAEQLLAGQNPVGVYRKYRGMAQSELAAAAGINVVYLSQIETGKRTGSAKTLAALAKALKVRVDDLL